MYRVKEISQPLPLLFLLLFLCPYVSFLFLFVLSPPLPPSFSLSLCLLSFSFCSQSSSSSFFFFVPTSPFFFFVPTSPFFSFCSQSSSNLTAGTSVNVPGSYSRSGCICASCDNCYRAKPWRGMSCRGMAWCSSYSRTWLTTQYQESGS